MVQAWLDQKTYAGRTRPCQSRDGSWLENGRLFFRDKTIFSYGDHFPIATLIPERKAVLLTYNTFPCPMRNDGRQSPTTRIHVEQVQRACQFAKLREVVCSDPVLRSVRIGGSPFYSPHEVNLGDFRSRLYATFDCLVARHRNVPEPGAPGCQMGRFEWQLSRFRDYVEFFDLPPFDRQGGTLHGLLCLEMTVEENAKLLINKVIEKRNKIRTSRRKVTARRYREKRKTLIAETKQRLAREEKEAARRLSSRQDRYQLLAADVAEPEGHYGLPVRKIGNHRRGINLLVFN